MRDSSLNSFGSKQLIVHSESGVLDAVLVGHLGAVSFAEEFVEHHLLLKMKHFGK